MDGRIFDINGQIKQQLSRDWTVEKMASDFGVSTTRFQRLFKQRTGTIPMGYLRSLSLFTILSVSGLIFAQSDEIRIETTFVRVPVVVFDREGHFTPQLKRENFKLFEDGNEQEITHFESYNEPITVLLLLDTSGSMIPHFNRLAGAVSMFVDGLRSEDRIIIATFVDDSKINLLKNSKKKDLTGGITLTPRPGDQFTTTFDAVDRGLKLLEGVNGRKAMVLFTDGELFGWKASAKSNIRDAEEGEAVIYTVRFGEFPTHQPGFTNRTLTNKEMDAIKKRVHSYIQSLSNETGGRSFEVEAIDDLGAVFKTVADELGQHYTLGYYPGRPTQKGERRILKVEVNVPNSVVHARRDIVIDK